MKNDNYLAADFYANVDPMYMAPDEEQQATEGEDSDESVKPGVNVPEEKQ